MEPEEQETEQEEAEDRGTTLELYNVLLTGAKIKMQFSSIQEASALRAALAVVKHRQDKFAVALDLFQTSDIMKFKFDIKKKGPPIEVVLSFVSKLDVRQFTFQVMEDETIEVNSEVREETNECKTDR